MKKIFVSMFMLAAAVSASAENSISVVPFKAAPGATVDALINICNETPNCAPQFEIHLPVGFSFVSKAKSCAVIKEETARTYNEDDDEYCFSSASRNLKTDALDGHNYVSVAFSGGYDLIGNEGVCFKSSIVVDPTVAPGVYPIYIKNYYFADYALKNKVNLKDRVYTSYVVVGEGGDVALEGEVPSFVNKALADETAISKLDLSAVTASYGTFTYVDGREVVAPTADVTATAAYKKTVSKYASLTMPFDADLTGKGAYVFGSVSGNTANFTDATSVNAGDVVLLTQSVELEGTKLGDATKSVQSDAYYVAPDGQSLHKGTNVTVPALRGYWNVGGGASNLRIALDGVLTDINMVDVQGEGAQAFDLQGRQVQNAKNGVFVVNGKKQFVK